MMNLMRKTGLIFLLTQVVMAACTCKAEPIEDEIPLSVDPDCSLQSGTWWQPQPGDTLQWQLTGELDLTVDADIYDIDLFETSAKEIRALHYANRKVICYISVGTREDFRPDADGFPPEVIGKPYTGWPGERWLDIRRFERFAPVMEARLDLAASKCCDGIEPDNMDGYDSDTGFAISRADQLAYLRWLIDQAHQRGLSIGMKNSPELAADLVDDFDWALLEDCTPDGWCAAFTPFTRQGKTVFQVAYTDRVSDLDAFCPQAGENGFSGLLKHRNLDDWLLLCP